MTRQQKEIVLTGTKRVKTNALDPEYVDRVTAALDALPHDTYLSVAEMAAFFEVKKLTIYSWRRRQYGPPYSFVGGRNRYRVADARAWLQLRPRKKPRRVREFAGFDPSRNEDCHPLVRQLFDAIYQKHARIARVARAAGMHYQSAYKWRDDHTEPGLFAFERALAALGLELVIQQR